MKNMNQLMKQAKKMQEEMMKAQEALGEQKVEGTAGGGAVKVVATGHKLVESITIVPDAVDPNDVEMLQDLVLTAVNDALKKADEIASNEMSKQTRGLNLPGLF
ncbi:MAG: YbaB/EbfC family nucleoid-associated protein [Bacilli bacterium]|nr:YbaB/EbfC family nucleoid-associated protein [Bacilli bacterium]